MDFTYADTVSTVFTDWATVYLTSMAQGATPTSLDGEIIRVKLYTRSPILLTSSTDIQAVVNLAELDTKLGWVPVVNQQITNSYMRDWYDGDQGTGGAFTLQNTVVADTWFFQVGHEDGGFNPISVEDGNGWLWVEDADETLTLTPPWPLPPYDQEVIATAVFYIQGAFDGHTDPVLFVTTYNIGDGTVIHPGCLLSCYSTSSPWPGDNPYLFQYAPSATPNVALPETYGQTSVGTLLFQPAPPRWEPAHVTHLWIAPERINLIANPTFQKAYGTAWVT